MKSPLRRLSLEAKRCLMFYVFTAPFLLGLILFFLYPFIQSFLFSVNRLTISPDGYQLEFVGLRNYQAILLEDPVFSRIFVESIFQTLSSVPMVLGFSLLMAVILNQQFKGRIWARLILFLPIILGSGIVARMEQGDYMAYVMQMSLEGGDSLLGGAALRQFLFHLQLPIETLEYVVSAVDRVTDIIFASGIQILIFLAGLQSISPSLFEAAEVEGATAWECFWLITLPMLGPLVVTNTVYTIIDSFFAVDNQLVRVINQTAFRGGGYGASTAMSMLYFFVIALVLTGLMGVFSRWVFYHE